jgi:histidinol phosphatase-like enzyme (inositol monophosphatase family)
MAALDRPLIDLALRLAAAAQPIARTYFRQPIPVDDKADKSPVTVADREIEQTLRRILAAERPQDGVIGEEYGADRPDAAHAWVIDPIDGTKSFITGKPSFGTLIGLLHRGEPVLGIIFQPITGELWLGAKGHPSTLDGREIRTRTGRALGQAYLYSTAPEMFAEGEEAQAFARLSARVKCTRFGADCYAYGLLACGCVDLVCEADLKLHDYTALFPVIEGAGGKVADWTGRRPPFAAGKVPGRILAAGSADIFDAAKDALAP